MGKYAKYILAVLYLLQVYIIFGEHIVETYRHIMEALSPPTIAAREFVANAVLRREVTAASHTGEMVHQAMGIMHVPAAFSLVLKDAHIVHPNDDEDGPEAKDRPREGRRKRRERAPPNLFRQIRKFRRPIGSTGEHKPTSMRLTLLRPREY